MRPATWCWPGTMSGFFSAWLRFASLMHPPSLSRPWLSKKGSRFLIGLPLGISCCLLMHLISPAYTSSCTDQMTMFLTSQTLSLWLQFHNSAIPYKNCLHWWFAWRHEQRAMNEQWHEAGSSSGKTFTLAVVLRVETLGLMSVSELGLTRS